ncbi:signal peptide peptidase SppA [Oceanicella actignis]|uniref:Protease-4 n=1 Tax=Oceanicella actignis TaxID=1189325 RepID=A0A1M7SHN6_9RHOB|nr:signal peptide peptidase SppA [Oceanicella actignis]SET19722.1 protease-4 [Oceanicella actignis]SHN57872.1 protease-4 [Oceanicella actignis]
MTTLDDIERRRLRRRLWFWRILALILLAVAAAALLAPEPGPSGPRVARVQLSGVIADDPERDAFLESLAEDDEVRAVILRINSPGGTTVGAEALYDSLRRLAARKPLVAIAGEVAASGAYIAALAADRFIVRGNSIVGSIGVIAQHPELSELLDSIGVRMVEVKSSPLKAAPSPFAPADEAALEVERAMIRDAYAWFRDLVAERRGLRGAALERVADGRIMTGRMAVAAGLADQIGAEREARAWLEERGVPADLPVADARPREKGASTLERLIDLLRGAGSAARALTAGPRLMSIQR